jgi:uncharacterized repeat protein (TIGR04076 family)
MKRYSLEIEIFEGQGGELRQAGEEVLLPDFTEQEPCSWMERGDGTRTYHVGDRFRYPEDAGKICPWLMGSLYGILTTLRYGGTLSWTYEGTPYEKVIDKDGLTTEFVRCPDPTRSGIVVKVIRRELGQ